MGGSWFCANRSSTDPGRSTQGPRALRDWRRFRDAPASLGGRPEGITVGKVFASETSPTQREQTDREHGDRGLVSSMCPCVPKEPGHSTPISASRRHGLCTTHPWTYCPCPQQAFRSTKLLFRGVIRARMTRSGIGNGPLTVSPIRSGHLHRRSDRVRRPAALSCARREYGAVLLASLSCGAGRLGRSALVVGPAVGTCWAVHRKPCCCRQSAPHTHRCCLPIGGGHGR